MLINDDTLKALYSSDLNAFLDKANLKVAFYEGSIKCIYCKSVISKSNLYAFIPNVDHFDSCCTNANCILQLIKEAKQ